VKLLSTMDELESRRRSEGAHRPSFPFEEQRSRNRHPAPWARRVAVAAGAALLVCACSCVSAAEHSQPGTVARGPSVPQSGKLRTSFELRGKPGLRGAAGSLDSRASSPLEEDEEGIESDSDVSVELTSIIGFGSFSTVYAGKTNRGDSLAVKRVQLQNTDEINRKRLQREIRILSAMDHPNIVRLLRVIEDDECISLVQERCMGGELFDFVNDFQTFHATGERSWRRTNTTEMLTVTEEHIAKMVRQILLAVEYMHSCNVVHRDLKLENVMLTAPFAADTIPEVKVVDLGFSRQVSGVVASYPKP